MADDKKGMLRHVDILGRVVIPREVRKALRISYGDLMEFSACSDKQVVMRKFHLIREIASLADSIVKVAIKGRNCEILVVDTEKVVCLNGQKDLRTDDIPAELVEILNARMPVEKQGGFKITQNYALQNKSIIYPIVSGGDLLGGVILTSQEEITEVYKDIAKTICDFLAEYFLS